MRTRGAVDVMTPAEVEAIEQATLTVLERTGVRVEHEALLDRLAEWGAQVDRTQGRARFPRRLMEQFLADSLDEFEEIDGVQTSCLFPFGRRAAYAHGVECTAGTYPQNLLTLDGRVVPHTRESAAWMTRLADRLDHLDRLGVMGIPNDVPGPVQPLYMRLIAWKHAERKLSGCGEVHNPALVPYIVEMGQIAAEAKGVSVRTTTFAEVEMISPLRLARQEATIFEEFARRGLLCGIGFMHTAGGSAPATLAGTVVLDMAESLFINVLYRLYYGWRKLWIQTNSSLVDMRTLNYVFGRPERGLLILSAGQMARHWRAGLWASAIYPDAKTFGPEIGMQTAFNCIPSILAGSLGLECFGILSGGEMSSPLQLVIDNEFCGGLKRFARGYEVDAETLAVDLIDAVGPGGLFTDQVHTAEHYRSEHWMPRFFTSQNLSCWLASDRKTELDHARQIMEDILATHHPRGIDEQTERRLQAVIDRATRDLVQ